MILWKMEGTEAIPNVSLLSRNNRLCVLITTSCRDSFSAQFAGKHVPNLIW